MVYRTLVLCHANIGRSPGICSVMEYLAARDGRDDLIFESAGLGYGTIKMFRQHGCDRTSQDVAKILREQGIPIEERAIRFYSEAEGPFDRILTADRFQRDLFRDSPDKEKVLTVKEFAEGVDGDVLDAHQLISEVGIKSGDPEYEIAYRTMCWSLKRLAENAYKRILLEAPEPGPV